MARFGLATLRISVGNCLSFLGPSVMNMTRPPNSATRRSGVILATCSHGVRPSTPMWSLMWMSAACRTHHVSTRSSLGIIVPILLSRAHGPRAVLNRTLNVWAQRSARLLAWGSCSGKSSVMARWLLMSRIIPARALVAGSLSDLTMACVCARGSPSNNAYNLLCFLLARERVQTLRLSSSICGTIMVSSRP